MTVPGAGFLSSQECEKNPEESYDEHRLLITYTKGKGRHKRTVKERLVYKTPKQKTAQHAIRMCKEAYEYMLTIAPSPKLEKVWHSLNDDQRLRAHFDLIAHDRHAISYSYEVLDD